MYVDELFLLNGAHLALEPSISASITYTLQAQIIYGSGFIQDNSKLGTLHVGPYQEIVVKQSSLYVAANIRIYEGGQMTLPSSSKWINARNIINGILGGVSEVTLLNSMIRLGPTSQTKGMTSFAKYKFSAVSIMADSTLQSMDENTVYVFSFDKLYIAATGAIVGSRITLETTKVEIEEGGQLNLDAGCNLSSGKGRKRFEKYRDNRDRDIEIMVILQGQNFCNC